jgi:hypothetical protein
MPDLNRRPFAPHANALASAPIPVKRILTLIFSFFLTDDRCLRKGTSGGCFLVKFVVELKGINGEKENEKIR